MDDVWMIEEGLYFDFSDKVDFSFLIQLFFNDNF